MIKDFHLQRQFEDLEINESDFISDKLARFISLRDKMAAIGKFHSDRELLLWLLAKLLLSSETFVDTIITLKKWERRKDYEEWWFRKSVYL